MHEGLEGAQLLLPLWSDLLRVLEMQPAEPDHEVVLIRKAGRLQARGSRGGLGERREIDVRRQVDIAGRTERIVNALMVGK